MALATRTRRRGVEQSRLHPFLTYKTKTGLPQNELPDIIEFTCSDEYLNRPNLYPRQATILKTIFGATELFTDYDWWVLEQWANSYERTGDRGIQPDIEDRLRTLKEEERPWFREVVGVLGRRGSKGYLGAVSGAFVTWNYIALKGGDPQAYFGVARDKKLTAFVFAGKRDQAKANQWKDLVQVIMGAPCFEPYINKSLGESLSIYSLADLDRLGEMDRRGIETAMDLATFEILPKESTAMAGRGPASFCLDPTTPVLTADLTWVAIGDLNEGDALVGIDEYPQSKGMGRRLRETKVEKVWRTRKPAMRLTFGDGSSVVCSEDHRWLHKDFGTGGTYKWRKAGTLSVGSRIRHLVDPWEVDYSHDAGYLAGFFDGEGCVSGWEGRSGKDVLYSQNPGPTFDRVQRLLRERGFTIVPHNHIARSGEPGCQQWKLGSPADAIRFLGQIPTERLYERQRLVWEGVAPRTTGHSPGLKTVVSIEHLPEQELVDIQTSTGTFVANGLFSHNCQFYDEMAHVVNSGANRSAEEVYCLDPSTRILTSDLAWMPIGEVEVGQRLVGFDEYPESPGKQRYLREATVKGVTWSRSRPLRLTFEDGTSVVCSKNHRWFRVSEDCNNGKWVKAGYTRREGSAGSATRLKVGDYIRHIVDPWEEDRSWEAGYLAGIYDGEAFVSSPRSSAFKVGFVQNPGTVFDITWEMLREKGFEPVEITNHSESSCRTTELRGLAECLRFLGQIRPRRLLEKSVGFWEGKAPRGKLKHKRIASIEELPEQDLVDIETSTKTFIAEGLVSHNSAATPALDQFGVYAFIFEGSSPWQMTGQFYQNYLNAIEIDPETKRAAYPDMLMLQLTSWDPYEDWERAHEIEMWPGGPKFQRLKRAIQSYDLNMQRLERANPDTFKVERRSKFASVLDAYLPTENVERLFEGWQGEQLEIQERGILSRTYKAHGDPSKSGARFGFAIAHTEPDPLDPEIKHVVFDVIHAWDPADYEDHHLDYGEVEDDLWDYLTAFMPYEMTFDQFNSASVISRFTKKVRKSTLPKKPLVYEKSATAELNWRRFEVFKTALGLDWVHAPYHEVADLELRFLQEKNTQGKFGRVDHPDSGPVQTKDVADCIVECVWSLIGDQVSNTIEMLSDVSLGGAMQGGMSTGVNETRPGQASKEVAVKEAMSQFSKARRSSPAYGAARRPRGPRA